MKIGITEAGDAALDLSWESKINDCEGVILITKHVTDELIDKILAYKDKIILHATTTGMGGTVIEPNVPAYKIQLAQVKKLLDAGFPKNQIIIRIDPIVPTEKGLRTAQKVIDAANAIGLYNFRFSVLDTYPHVRERFKQKNIPLPYGENFSASDEMFDRVGNWLESQRRPNVFECCAEPKLAKYGFIMQVGCVSQHDIGTLHLTPDAGYQTGLQRRGCLCLSCKTELLHNKHRCPHGCLYCYWKD